MQIEQRIDQDTVISPQLTLLGQQGSRVLRGNLMSIPIENAIIYVEPIYIQAVGGENNLPELKKVVVCYQNEIVMADSLELALAQVFDIQELQNNNQPVQSSAYWDLVLKAPQVIYPIQSAQPTDQTIGELWFELLS